MQYIFAVYRRDSNKRAMFNKRVSENLFSHATSEAELRASKNMKFT